MMSPTSVLDSRYFSAFKTPFCSDSQCKNPRTSKPEYRNHWDILNSKRALGLFDVLTDELSDTKLLKSESRMVLFGSQLKIRIPSLSPSLLSPSVNSPMSPGDFSTRTKNSPISSFSPSCSSKISPFGSSKSCLENLESPRIFSSSSSADELELSEDYTRVIAYGPNPRTTHIFDDCIIESCCGIVGLSASLKKGNGFPADRSSSYTSESFLSFCYNCNKNLDQGIDIYMYRGEKAFCSGECRDKEIMSEESVGKYGYKSHIGKSYF
ncbi:hypothetical protein AgCh_029024 [Apium graveolens]